MTPFPPAGSWPDSAGTNFGRCGGQGVAGTNCAVTSGFHPNAIGQAPAMGDHSFNGTQSVDDIYMRHYRKFLPGFQFGAEKIWTVNACCAGIGGIKFANNSLGAVAAVGSQASPVTTVAAEDANRSWNYTVTSGNWYYIEEHIKLNTPGVANGVLEIWADNCGANGLGCTGTPTLRAQYTNVLWRLAGDNTQIGSIWLESWSNIPSIGEEYYDQIKVSKVGPIGFTPMGTPPSDIVAPTVSMTAPTSGATVSGSAVAVSANASDNVGVAGVQFQLDGVDLGAELTAVPYSLSWNTTTASDGAHTLTAVERDAAGNVATSAPVSVTTLNTAPTPPVISNVAASNVTSSSATLTWTTNAVSSSQVEYGRSTAYGNVTLLDTSLVTVHSQTLSGLGKNTWYHYRVLSRHAGGNLAVSGDFAFKTRPK